MKKLAVLTLLFAALFAVSSPQMASASAVNSHSRSHPAFFDKTRFAAHLGLAYFAFHHFVYKPYRNGSFKNGASHRTRTILKAGAALLFTYHELRTAYNIANGSSSHVLKVLVKPLKGLVAYAQRVDNQLRGGRYSDAQVKGLTDSANAFSKKATSGGINIKDVPVPGLGS